MQLQRSTSSKFQNHERSQLEYVVIRL